MDWLQWSRIVSIIIVTSRRLSRDDRLSFSDLLIMKMFFWTVIHNKPLYWACERKNYHGRFRPRALPSVSQFCRRVNSPRFHRHLQLMHDVLIERAKFSRLFFMDGKALPVSPVSGDPDAKVGRAGGVFAKGYKLHALMSVDRKIIGWSVTSLNIHEVRVAHHLVEQLPPVSDSRTLIVDGNYDSKHLHNQAWERNTRLITWPRGRAKDPSKRRRMGDARRTMIDAWEKSPAAMWKIYKQRDEIERGFGVLTCRHDLLGPLPAFVRRINRVRRWVGAKIILYNARIGALQNAEAA